jgi:hypothetical protein
MSVVRFEKQLKASTHRQRPFPRFVYSKRERRLDPDPPSPEELAGFRFWAPSETEVGSWRWELSRHARIRNGQAWLLAGVSRRVRESGSFT